MPNITIRPYVSSDYAALCAIHDAARRVELALASLDGAFLPFSIAAGREDFFDYPHIEVAEVDGAAGFSAYTSGELAWLYVSPDMARQGVGRSLAAHALAKEPGIREIEVLYGNELAKRLYESMGFSVCEAVEGVMPGNEAYSVKVYRMERRQTG